MEPEDIPSKTPGSNPTKVLINSLPSRRVSKERCHITPFSNMRNTLRPSRGISWSQLQPMTVKKSQMGHTNLKTLEIVMSSSNGKVFHVQCLQQGDMGKTIVRKHAPTLDAQSVWRDLSHICQHHLRDSMKGIDYMPMSPQLSMIRHRKELLNNLFFISMNSSDKWMKLHQWKNISLILSG